MNDLISTREASERLKISVRRVQALIAAGRLPAEKIGNRFVIKESDLGLISRRKNGRPQNGNKPEEKDWNALIDEFAGCIDDGPPDLSTNKKYMEGFGQPRKSNVSETKDWSKLIKKFSGSVKGLPPDLSTNKKYMEGFGK